MQSKFQERLLTRAITYFTQTNTSQLSGQNPLFAAWNTSTHFLWQQASHARSLYHGRSPVTPSYHHHGPDGLERACMLLRFFKIISIDDESLLKHALSRTGTERKLSIEAVLSSRSSVETNDSDDEQASLLSAQANTTSNLPNFTDTDIDQLKLFVKYEDEILQSTFGQEVFSAAFSCLGVFETDLRNTAPKQLLTEKLQQWKPHHNATDTSAAELMRHSL